MSQLQPKPGQGGSSTTTAPPAPTSTSTPKPGPKLARGGSVFNPRSMTAPIAAAVMAGLLFTYAVTSIRAAKRNARLHREADGGQVDMRKESLRQHGLADKVAGTTTFELFRDAGRGVLSNSDSVNETDEHKYLRGGRALPLATPQHEESGKPRTEIEAGLEGIRGLTQAGDKHQRK